MLAVKTPSANAGGIRDAGSIPGLGRSPGGGHSNPLYYSCLENSMDKGAWKSTVYGVSTRPRDSHTHTHTHTHTHKPVAREQPKCPSTKK